MTAEEWEAQFAGIDLPDEMQLDPGVKITNVSGFLEKSLTILKAGNARVSEPVEWRLQKLLDLINNGHENS
jgi:hypothetical protein